MVSFVENLYPYFTFVIQEKIAISWKGSTRPLRRLRMGQSPKPSSTEPIFWVLLEFDGLLFFKNRYWNWYCLCGFMKNWYWNWNWHCLCAFLRIGIGTGIVYTMTEELVLILELFILCLKNWYWDWNCLYNDWRLGIGTGIVYTMTEELVLVLELFILCLKNWYWYWNCLYYVWRIGTGIDPKKVVLPISGMGY